VTALKVGVRLRSTKSTAEIILTKGRPAIISCAGAAMVPVDNDEVSQPPLAPKADAGPQVLVGKRYQTPDGAIQVLGVKQGDGGLETDGVYLEMVTPKLLPASD
jgi:hypothetical protein